MKRIISLILAVLLLCPTFAMADATKAPKKDYYAKKTSSSSSSKKLYEPRDNDIKLYTFTDAAPGSLPGGITGSGSYGTVATEEMDVDGKKKNCLVLTDIDSSTDNNGVKASVDAGGAKGIVGVDFRIKYIPDETSDWVNFVADFRGEKNYMSRFMIHSTTGILRFNNTGAHNTGFEKIAHDTWYTINYTINTETGYVDAMFTNEATGNNVTIFDADHLNKSEVFNNISMETLRYSGKVVFDYIRIYQAENMLSQREMDLNIEKGTTQIRVPAPAAKPVEGRINIMVDGEYKYTTLKPYVSQTGNVMATAKNLALMFDLKYSREGSLYTMENDTTKIVIDMASGTAQVNGKNAAIKEPAVLEGLQVYVPVESVASILDLEYSYDDAKKLVTIAKGGNE